jgi:hypothetical protein
MFERLTGKRRGITLPTSQLGSMSGLRGTFYKVVIKRDPLLITLGMDAVLHALASQESATKEHAMYIVARAVPRGNAPIKRFSLEN